MKRSRLIPELTDPPRRKRTLSEEERALWETVAKQTRPLRKKPRAAKAAPEAEMSAATKIAHAEPSSSARMLRASKAASAPPPPPLAPLGRRERSQLSRGRKEIDARLDLHGMTQKCAHRVLHEFLRQARADSLTFVLVITGKGKTTAALSDRGVLRRQVSHWLALPEFRTMVVGFEEAHIGHGVEGALYVRLRRVRSER